MKVKKPRLKINHGRTTLVNERCLRFNSYRIGQFTSSKKGSRSVSI